MPHNGVFHVVAICQSRPGLEHVVREVLEPLVPSALLEPGCLKYTLHVDRDDPCKFVFFESWADREALETHLATPASKELAVKLESLLVQPASLTLLQQLA